MEVGVGVPFLKFLCEEVLLTWIQWCAWLTTCLGHKCKTKQLDALMSYVIRYE